MRKLTTRGGAEVDHTSYTDDCCLGTSWQQDVHFPKCHFCALVRENPFAHHSDRTTAHKNILLQFLYFGCY